MTRPPFAILGVLLLVAGAEAALAVQLDRGYAAQAADRVGFHDATEALKAATAKLPMIVTPVPFEDMGEGQEMTVVENMARRLKIARQIDCDMGLS